MDSGFFLLELQMTLHAKHLTHTIDIVGILYNGFDFHSEN